MRNISKAWVFILALVFALVVSHAAQLSGRKDKLTILYAEKPTGQHAGDSSLLVDCGIPITVHVFLPVRMGQGGSVQRVRIKYGLEAPVTEKWMNVRGAVLKSPDGAATAKHLLHVDSVVFEFAPSAVNKRTFTFITKGLAGKLVDEPICNALKH